MNEFDFREPKYIKRYEDVFFDLETPLISNVGNNERQNKDNYRFSIDRVSEVHPLDVYYFTSEMRISKLSKMLMEQAS